MISQRPRLGTASRRLSTQRPTNHVHLSTRYRTSPTEDRSTVPNARDERLARIEAVLFIAGEPLTSKQLAAAAGLADAKEAERLLDRLRELLIADESAFELHQSAGGVRLMTRPVYYSWLLRLRRSTPGDELRLTSAQMETLAVIAYKQPVTRAELESVRGVGCGETIRALVEKGLVRLAGRHQSLGRPQLYGTTKKFLIGFGLNSLADLPGSSS